jgi:hypothetical protein
VSVRARVSLVIAYSVNAGGRAGGPRSRPRPFNMQRSVEAPVRHQQRWLHTRMRAGNPSGALIRPTSRPQEDGRSVVVGGDIMLSRQTGSCIANCPSRFFGCRDPENCRARGDLPPFRSILSTARRKNDRAMTQADRSVAGFPFLPLARSRHVIAGGELFVPKALITSRRCLIARGEPPILHGGSWPQRARCVRR